MDDALFDDLINAFFDDSYHPFVEPDPVAFLERFVYDPETGDFLKLQDETKDVLRYFASRDDSGNFLFSTWLYGAIKKHGKTTICAGLGLWWAWQIPNGQVYVIGNDQKQADSRLFRVIEYACKNHPIMKNHVKVINYKITLSNGTIIESLPLDPTGEAGMNPTAIIWTESWGAKGKKADLMWTEATLSPSRAGQSFRLVESYAGYKGESVVLERLYNSVIADEYVVRPEIELYANPAAGIVGYWLTRRIQPWQQGELADQYYAGERATKTPEEYARQHLNQWTTSVNTFVPYVWWEACAIDTMPAGWQDNYMVIALDAAVSDDCFALVGVVKRHDDTANTNTYYVPLVRVWAPPRGGTIDFDDVYEYILQLRDQYKIACITYDPYQLHDMATRLEKSGIWADPFGQGTPRLTADKALYDRIRDRRVLHLDDPQLNEHIRNANSKQNGDKLRIVKSAHDKKVDAAVALSMAVEKANELSI